MYLFVSFDWTDVWAVHLRISQTILDQLDALFHSEFLHCHAVFDLIEARHAYFRVDIARVLHNVW
jgi:hypothetical protein